VQRILHGVLEEILVMMDLTQAMKKKTQMMRILKTTVIRIVMRTAMRIAMRVAMRIALCLVMKKRR
jgi:hypothetical protein